MFSFSARGIIDVQTGSFGAELSELQSSRRSILYLFILFSTIRLKKLWENRKFKRRLMLHNNVENSYTHLNEFFSQIHLDSLLFLHLRSFLISSPFLLTVAEASTSSFSRAVWFFFQPFICS